MSTHSIRWIAIPLLTIGMLLCSIGCSHVADKETAAAATTKDHATPALEQAREAAQMAVAMEKEPARATEILETHHQTRASYEDLLFKIARDPALSDAYDAARTS